MSAGHLSPVDLDLLVLGTGPAAGTRPAQERHLRECPACEARRQRRAARHDEFQRDRLPHLLARLSTRAPRRWRAVWLLALVPAAATALFLVWPVGHPAGVAPGPGSVGVKGPHGIRLVARRGDAVFEVEPGARLHAGDALRFVLEPVGRPYLMIASLDGQGKASVYHPFAGASSARVDPERLVEAPAGSVVLDTAPGPERVFALWSAEPLQAADVLARLNELALRGPEAIRTTNTLDVPGTIQVSSLFEKGDSP